MLITDLKEFRLYFPTHAYDTLDPFVGVLDNSEHDFLQEKLGTPLYNALCDWYAQNAASLSLVDARTVVAGSASDIGYYNRLLLLAQRCIAYDAMQRAISMNIISINNAGVNISTADDYGKVDLQAVAEFKTACIKESHAAVNRLLQALEEWCQQAAAQKAAVPDASPLGIDTELADICQKWRSSRYFYLSTSLLIPTATCLQTYINIYDSREKFIQLLPDLLYIQEEIIATAIGEDFLAYLVRCSVNGGSAPVIATIIHRLRKVMAALLVERTSVLKYTKEQRIQAHDDGVRMLDVACTYIRNHQPAILAALDATVPDASASALTEEERTALIATARAPFTSSPLYAKEEATATVPATSASGKNGCVCCNTIAAKDPSRTYAKGDPAAWTPPLL